MISSGISVRKANLNPLKYRCGPCVFLCQAETCLNVVSLIWCVCVSNWDGFPLTTTVFDCNLFEG